MLKVRLFFTKPYFSNPFSTFEKLLPAFIKKLFLFSSNTVLEPKISQVANTKKSITQKKIAFNKFLIFLMNIKLRMKNKTKLNNKIPRHSNDEVAKYL